MIIDSRVCNILQPQDLRENGLRRPAGANLCQFDPICTVRKTVDTPNQADPKNELQATDSPQNSLP